MATFQTPVDIQAALTVDGPVGIGTAEPAQKLSVAGIVESTSGGFKFPDGSMQATAVSGAANADGHSLDTADGSQADVVFVDNKGNVGIGTTNPGAKLHVAGDLRVSGAKLELNSGGADSAAVLGVSTPDAQDFVSLSGGRLNSQSPRVAWRRGALRFGTATSFAGQAWSEKMRISDTGNVGIGTTTPRARLEVAGDTILGGNVGIGLNPEANRKFQVHSTNANERITFAGNYSGKNQNSDSPKLTFAGQYQTAGVSIQGINVAANGRERMAFFTHNADDYATEAEVMSLTPDGNVGIGTTTPRAKLEVAGDTILGGNVGIGTTEPHARLSIRGIGGTALTIESPTGDARNYALQISYVKYGDFGILQSNAHEGNPVSAGTTALYIDRARNVGIGTTAPGSKLDVVGDVHASGKFLNTSDLRLKAHVAPLSGVLEKLGGLHAVSFDWNEQHQSHDDSSGQRQLGLIAQDVEAAFPELVTTLGEEGYKAVDYGRLTAVLVEAVRELRAENTTLRQRTEVLEKATADR